MHWLHRLRSALQSRTADDQGSPTWPAFSNLLAARLAGRTRSRGREAIALLGWLHPGSAQLAGEAWAPAGSGCHGLVELVSGAARRRSGHRWRRGGATRRASTSSRETQCSSGTAASITCTETMRIGQGVVGAVQAARHQGPQQRPQGLGRCRRVEQLDQLGRFMGRAPPAAVALW